ncbi:MAG: hypothetical protein GY796_32905 [Chloroflexi bacterium]|nr:hypothetical protein [Chloroflexota bacterium]
MDFIKKNIPVILAFIIGWIVGLVVFGWWLWPVQWTDAPPDALSPQYKATYINTTAVSYAQTQNPQVVTNAFVGWSDPYTDICTVATTTPDPNIQPVVYNEMAKVVSGGQDCTAAAVPPTEGGDAAQPAEDTGGANTTVVLFLILILVALAIAIVYVLRKRQSVTDDEEPSTYYDMPETTPVSDDETAAIPLARFPSNYSYGRDNFDDSHSIENNAGDFMGECGIGISESIGTDTPKNVTAFEVWLFDKNDIRTVTKVIMSDHAFFDDALKAKLAPKGEPVLARENEVIVLETASLIVNAEIKQMQYGESGSLPPQSFFERFEIELSAWAKDAEFSEPDVQDQVDDLLDY